MDPEKHIPTRETPITFNYTTSSQITTPTGPIQIETIVPVEPPAKRRSQRSRNVTFL